jgi:hypothetical protein
MVDGIRGKAIRLDGASYLRVAEPAVFNAPELTVSLWVKPERLNGRWGIIAKRFNGGAAPWVICQNGAGLSFEAASPDGKWPWIMQTGPVLVEKAWTHVAVVMQRGRVSIYVNGKLAASLEKDLLRVPNGEPLIIGREAWGGDPPKGDTAAMFLGCLDQIKVWTRALPEGEIQAEFKADRPAK